MAYKVLECFKCGKPGSLYTNIDKNGQKILYCRHYNKMTKTKSGRATSVWCRIGIDCSSEISEVFG